MEKSSLQTIGKKWFFILSICLVGCIGLSGYIIFSIININRYNELSHQIDRILISSQKCTVAAEEFLMNAYTDENFVRNGTNDSFKNFNTNMEAVVSLTESYKNSGYLDTEAKKQSIGKLEKYLNSYKQGFYSLANLFKEKGFKDLGLEGEMRKSIHFIENHEAKVDLEHLLTLRRHEKDFLLRKDLKYVEKFNDELLIFKNFIGFKLVLNSNSQREELLKALSSYQASFEKIVEIEKKIGLNATSGQRVEFTNTLNNIETLLNEVSSEIKDQKDIASKAINIIVVSIILVFIFIIVAIYFGINYFNNAVIKPISRLNEAADMIAAGNLTVHLDQFRNRKLIKDLVTSFDKLIDKLRNTIQQIELISARKLLHTIELQSDDDEIGKTLNRIISEIQTIDLEEKKRTWTAEGLAQFGNISRENTNLKTLASNVLIFLVKYIKANQGGLYILEKDREGNEYLSLEAAYAYNRKKYISKKINLGEGLIGQCFKEKESVYLKEIPADYLQITSGFGDATPRTLLVAPFVHDDNAEAVIEFASFGDFEPYQVEFISKVGEMMASTIANTKANEVTKLLLAESKLRSDQMREQEEEMTTNLEEMMVTQEEFEAKEADFKEEILLLKEEIRNLKQKQFA
ncbi:MAG: GAF domain-containing protein [Cytophagales bacterium]